MINRAAPEEFAAGNEQVREWLKTFPYWKHNRTGNVYVVFDAGRLQVSIKEFDMVPVVIYHPVGHENCKWVRPLGEFVERFSGLKELPDAS